MSDPIGYIIPLITGIIGGLVTLIPLLWRRHLDMAQAGKAEAEEADKLTRIAMDLLTPLRERIDHQAGEIKLLGQKLEVAENLIRNQAMEIRSLTRKLKAAEALIDDLIRQLKDAGVEAHFGSKP